MTEPIALKDEPTGAGAVVRLNAGGKYDEIWVASNINIGRWYPSMEDWETGSVRHDLPQGADFWQLQKRGKVTLLVAGRQEAYEAGWRAGCRQVMQLADEAQWDVPGVPDGV